MTATVIQGAFLGGEPRLASVQPRLAPPPIQAKSAARLTATAFAGHPPGPPAPAFQARPPGPPSPAFARSGAVQRQGAGGAFAVEAGALGLASSGGRPLPDSVRGKMEAALGADFSGVRVHVGPQAERIGAIAFTLGSDIYFAPGRYQPDTVPGQQLLGHELAHVVQQRAGRVRNPLGSGLAVVQDHALEAEADRLGRHAAMHRGTAQAKMPAVATSPVAPMRISPPISAGPGSYRLTAGSGGRPIGSVMVHARAKGVVEVTDLNVAEPERGHGIGRLLLASAARTGQQFGRSKVSLAAQDNGSGHLTQWYKGMGFAQVGVNHRGFPQLEAPITRVLAGAAQRQATHWPRSDSGQLSRALPGVAQGRMQPRRASPMWPPQAQSPRARRFEPVVQRMEAPRATTAGHAEDFVILKNGFWLVKKVDKPEGEQYDNWRKHNNRPEIVPDYFGPFSSFADLTRQMQLQRIPYSNDEYVKMYNLDRSRNETDRLLLLSNIGQGSGRRPIDLKLGIHTASGTDQQRRGESFFGQYFKVTCHNIMDMRGPSSTYGVRDEGEHKKGWFLKGDDNLLPLKDRFARSPIESLIQIKKDLETARGWVSKASIVYVGSSVLIDIDEYAHTGRARMIDFAHPIYPEDRSFEEHKNGIILGLNTIIGFLEVEIEKKQASMAQIAAKQEEFERWERENPPLSLDWGSPHTPEYNPFSFRPERSQGPARPNLPNVLPGLTGVATDIGYRSPAEQTSGDRQPGLQGWAAQLKRERNLGVRGPSRK